MGHPGSDPARRPSPVSGQVGHVQGVPFVEDAFQPEEIIPPADDLPCQLQRKFIVSGGNRGVGGKNTTVADRIPVLRNDRFPSGLFRRLVQQRQGQQGGMAFVEMEGADVLITQGAVHPDAGVLILANDMAPSGVVVEVVDQVHLGGIYNITFSTTN